MERFLFVLTSNTRPARGHSRGRIRLVTRAGKLKTLVGSNSFGRRLYPRRLMEPKSTWQQLVNRCPQVEPWTSVPILKLRNTTWTHRKVRTLFTSPAAPTSEPQQERRFMIVPQSFRTSSRGNLMQVRPKLLREITSTIFWYVNTKQSIECRLL